MKTILLVDDEKSFLGSPSSGTSLFPESFNVLTAKSGRKAMEILKMSRVDAIVIDMKTPERDSFELLKHLKTKHPRIPVLVMTSPYGAELLDLSSEKDGQGLQDERQKGTAEEGKTAR